MVRRIRTAMILTCVVLMGIASYTAWPSVEAQNMPAPVHLDQLNINDANLINKIEEMGTTYYALENNAKKVTTKFKDGEAIAERDLDGTLRSRLTRIAGDVSQVKARGKELEITRQGSTVITAARDGVQPTLDWLNIQAYAIARDNLTPGQGLEWQQKYLRGRGKPGDDLEEAPLEITHEYDAGIVAVTKHNIPAKGEKAPHLSRNYYTEILKDGVRVGQLRYYVDAQAFFWDLPGLTKGRTNKDTEQLKGKKGFPFRVTLAWANVQAYAFYTMHSKLKAEGKVVGNVPSGGKGSNVPQGTGGCGVPPAKNLVGRVLEAFSPTLYAQDGCTGLHWLDNTVYRPCCDTHDRCYETWGCSMYTWFQWAVWGDTWACTFCNATAAWCFASSTGTGDCDCCVYMFSCCNPFQC